MKIEEFKQSLRSSLQQICEHNGWSFDNAKHRGMAFEDWCFRLLSDRYQPADNKPDQCILRNDDAGIDIFFESKETEEVYIFQCKHPKIAASDPIPEEDVKAFFGNYKLLSDQAYLLSRPTKNPKMEQLGSEFEYWQKKRFQISFIFASTGESGPKTDALVEKFNRDFQNENVKFAIWDIRGIRDEYVEVQSIEEKYPENVTLTLADNHFMRPAGELESLTFAVRGTALKDIALEHKDSLFNWNIRRFLGRKGEVNAGLTETVKKSPHHFYYFNNGISALCEEFRFDEKTKKLQISKLQIVNGAQTMGAIRNSSSENLKDVLVLVKLTAVKHAHREKGIAALLIKTNNTQNTLRAPDFRSNDKIQLWLEDKFKSTKARGELLQIVYGRKRPYPRSSSSQIAIKLQDLGKIRYAWYHDPRIPISDPARLFELPEEGGLYGQSFGAIDGEVVDVWSDDQFREALLAIHVFRRIERELDELSKQEDLKQVSRLKYYGLKLFKLYLDQMLSSGGVVSLDDLCAFGGKFNAFFDRAKPIITITLSRAYRDMLNRDGGTAFSLPRDAKVWDAVRRTFEDNLALVRQMEQAKAQ